MQMTDPMDVLMSFQEQMNGMGMLLQPGALHPDILVHLDHPNDTPRFTYVTLEGRTVTALAVCVIVEPLNGEPCLQLGYAVPERFRGQGFAKYIVQVAIDELKKGLGRAGIKFFSVEAVVGVDNQTSQHVAKVILSDAPAPIVDHDSGKPALHYVLRVKT